jgi:hypothetical protein
LLALCLLPNYGQVEGDVRPLKATMCELYEHAQQYAGKMVEVSASVAGNELWIDDFQQAACSSWMQIIVVFPENVRPAPGFNLVRDDSLTTFFEDIRKGKGVQATFEGRFDAAFVWRNHRKVIVGKDEGYGTKSRSGGRIVLRKLSNVVALPGSRL